MKDIPESLDFISIYHGMIGKDFITAFNSNFNTVDAQVIAILGELIYKVKSSDIKELRVKDGVVQYTTNGTTWKPIDITEWGNINGDITDQEDLKQALDSKAAFDTVETLKTFVNTINSNLSTLTGVVDETNKTLNNAENDINDIYRDLETRVKSLTIKEIRISNETFQWSPDGINWYQQEVVNSINWGNLKGNIEEQTDLYQILTELQRGVEDNKGSLESLQELFNTLESSINNLNEKINTNTKGISDLNNLISDINTALSNLNNSKANAVDLTNHLNDYGNPHKVTKTQLGLGNVDNTPDMEKPVSNPQSQAISEAINAAKQEIIGGNNIITNAGNVRGLGLMDYSTYISFGLDNSEVLVFVTDKIFQDTTSSNTVLAGTEATQTVDDLEVKVEVEEVTE